MPLPPGPFEDAPNPLDARVELTEAIRHPAYGEVSAWIDQAMQGAPSSGTVGRMELLRHWDGLPDEKRKLLLLPARDMRRSEVAG